MTPSQPRFVNRLVFSLLVLFLCFPVKVSHAQAKIAYLDASKIIKKMPEALDAQTRLDQFIATWTREADDIKNELDRKKTDYDRRKLIMTDAERNATELDLQNLQKRLNDYRESKYGNNGELYIQQGNLMKPAYDKLLKAIQEAAEDLKYDYVIDRSSRDIALLYANSKFDLTLIVAKKLGIESDILTQPLLSGQKPGTKPGQPGTAPGTIQTPGQQTPGAPPGTQPGSQPGNPQPGTPQQKPGASNSLGGSEQQYTCVSSLPSMLYPLSDVQPLPGSDGR